MANRNKRKQQNEPMRTRRTNENSRENACDQDAIGFGFASDWLSRRREFFKPIAERSKVKPKQFRVALDTLKPALAC